MIKFILGIGTLGLLMISCVAVTRNEPVNNQETLVIGDVQLQLTNYERWGPITINGVHDNNIVLFLESENGGEKHIIRSETGGLFYVYGLDTDKNYFIKKICHEEGGGSGMEKIYMEPGKAMSFRPVRGKVLVVGSLYGFIDQAEYKCELRLVNNLKNVKEKFLKYYKESKWNDYEFVESGRDLPNVPVNPVRPRGDAEKGSGDKDISRQ